MSKKNQLHPQDAEVFYNVSHHGSETEEGEDIKYYFGTK